MGREEDVLARILRVQIGGTEKSLRELYIEELDEWKELFVASIGGLDQLDPNSPGELGSIMNLGGNTILDLVVAYDKDDKLGGRAWLRKNATEREVYRVFREMLDVAFPFIRDAMGALAQMQAIREAVASASPSSTNGLSPTGASIPAPSEKG